MPFGLRNAPAKFSTVVAPHTDLMRGTVKVVWSPACQQAFERVKKTRNKKTSLFCSCFVCFLFNRPFKLFVDASHVGAGSVLTHTYNSGFDRPISLRLLEVIGYWLFKVIEKEVLDLVIKTFLCW